MNTRRFVDEYYTSLCGPCHNGGGGAGFDLSTMPCIKLQRQINNNTNSNHNAIFVFLRCAGHGSPVMRSYMCRLFRTYCFNAFDAKVFVLVQIAQVHNRTAGRTDRQKHVFPGLNRARRRNRTGPPLGKANVQTDFLLKTIVY